MNTFTEFGLLPSLLKTLKAQKIYIPTEIQKNAIPMLMSGQSVVGVSETGSGKTLTYALPLLHHLKNLENQNKPVTEVASPRAIVMVPTRDLGEQVSKVFKNYTHDTRLRVRPALGGMTLEQIRRNIDNPFEILLATPGRLIQLLKAELINLSDVQFLVFDEADQMLDQSFLAESIEIVEACSADTPKALFSATISTNVQAMINSLFTHAEVIRSSGSGKTVKSLITKNEIVIDGLRWPLFEKLLKQKVAGGTLVFTNTREQCDKLASEINEKGFTCLVYRGEMDKNERRSNLKKFRQNEVDLLVSTDLAGRGLDLEHVGRVINFHLPQQKENYLHRVGRTARAGKSGLVVNLVTERDLKLIAAIDEKKQSIQDLKKLFKGKDGKRLHLPRELVQKPQLEKEKPTKKTFVKKSTKPLFKPKPKPSEKTMAVAYGKPKIGRKK